MLKYIYNLYYKYNPPEMVSYWKTSDKARAKVTTANDGSYVMWIEGEKYPFPGYPRGHLLYGRLSKLKHEIKNQIFNRNFERLDEGKEIELYDALQNIKELSKGIMEDMIPVRLCAPAVREVHKSLKSKMWADIIAYIFQEDDAYRFRFQWMSKYLTKKDPIGSFDNAMEMLEHAEMVSDMKERVRLIRRVLNELWKDPYYAQFWIDFVQSLDLKKVRLSRADKYFFRAKYFKVDYPYFEY